MGRALSLTAALVLAAPLSCGVSARAPEASPRAVTVPLPPGFREVNLTIEGGADFPAVQAAIRQRLPDIAHRLDEALRIDPGLGGDLVIQLEVRPRESAASAKLAGGSLADVPAVYWAVEHAGRVDLPMHDTAYTARYTLAIDPRGAETPLDAADRAQLRYSALDVVTREGAPASSSAASALLPALERCMLAEDTGGVWVVARVTDGKVTLVPSGRETHSPGRDALYCIAAKLVRLRADTLGDTAFISFVAARRKTGDHPSGLPSGATADVGRSSKELKLLAPGSSDDVGGTLEVGGTPLAQVDASVLQRALSDQKISVRVPGDAHAPQDAIVFVWLTDRIAVVRRVPADKAGGCALVDGADAIDVSTGTGSCQKILDGLRAPPTKKNFFDP